MRRHIRGIDHVVLLVRDLDRALGLVTDLLQKYYWVVCDGYLDLDVKLNGDPLAAFRKASTQ